MLRKTAYLIFLILSLLLVTSCNSDIEVMDDPTKIPGVVEDPNVLPKERFLDATKMISFSKIILLVAEYGTQIICK